MIIGCSFLSGNFPVSHAIFYLLILFLVLEFLIGNHEFAYYKQDAQRISNLSELETQLSYQNIASTTIFDVDLIATFVSKGVSMLQAYGSWPLSNEDHLWFGGLFPAPLLSRSAAQEKIKELLCGLQRSFKYAFVHCTFFNAYIYI